MGPEITATGSLLNGTVAARKRTVEQPGAEQSTIHLESDIRADTRRLFYALTVPEYLETWISFPGPLSGCSILATKNNHEYMIDLCCDGIRKTIITGRYRVSERRRVVLSWRVEGVGALTESYVDVRLLGNFEYTTLSLRHHGLDSRQQYLWHRSLWSLSLERLSKLYDSLPHDHKSPHPRVRLPAAGL
jgi:hypothetical protein